MNSPPGVAFDRGVRAWVRRRTRGSTRSVQLLGLLACLAARPALADTERFSPGAPGAGDPYFPLDGNGGYDVEHYRLQIRYEPDSDRLTGVASISARATQALSRFNLDLDGLTVTSVGVDGCSASWSHEAGELSIDLARGIQKGDRFEAVVEYGGVPQPIPELLGSSSAFIHRENGALVLGEPHVASSWFPANDHPTDRASFRFEITVPAGLEVAANGSLVGESTDGGWTTWSWDAPEPMATYLAGMAIGELKIESYERDGLKYWDAIDADLFDQITPPTGSRLVLSNQADLSYKRLSRVIAVPDGGAQLSFWITRRTEPAFDYFFVEAHGVGEDDWTTLPDLDGIATPDTGAACLYWLELHPFLAHYQSGPTADGEPCSPAGTTGEWWAATGVNATAERWTVDLSAWAGRSVEVSLSYVSDDATQADGVWIDDIVVSTGEGSTSFEDDAAPFDGWLVAGAPPGSAPNANDWTLGTAANAPPPLGEAVEATLARQPEIVDFLERSFGPYPFDVAGAIAVEAGLDFAIENQTRPIYPASVIALGEARVVHELAHQWFGDSVGLQAWQHIWLNEGFAIYAEWLWFARLGEPTAQEIFDGWYDGSPPEDPFWSLVIGDPGPEHLFDYPVYFRGAMTLHQLRVSVGDATFFEILQTWADTYAGQNVTTDDFIGLAESLAQQDLGGLFEAWLFSPEKPSL